MSRLPGKESPHFVSLSERRLELVVCSKVEWWVSHWDVERRRSRRCGGVECALCAIGSPKVLRFVVLCLDGRGRECLLELRERHREIAERIDATVTNGDGVRIVVRKDGAAGNSPVDVRILGLEPCYRREISLLVSSFGLPALKGPAVPIGEASVAEPEGLNVADQPLQRNER